MKKIRVTADNFLSLLLGPEWEVYARVHEREDEIEVALHLHRAAIKSKRIDVLGFEELQQKLQGE